MNSIVFSNIVRFLFLFLLQVLVFQGYNASGEGIMSYVHIFIYPIFILLLPHDIPNWALILLGFLMGISVDFFYNSIGVNASASVLTATVRPYILRLQEPKGGYAPNQSPTRYRLGTAPYFRYAAILFFIHLFWYYCMERFTIAYINDIMIRTFVSFLVSMPIVMIHAFLFNPKN